MIPEIEKKVLEKINFADKYLSIRKKYSENEKSDWLYSKNDIVHAFKGLEYNIIYLSGGVYLIKKKYRNYLFEYRFIISKNNFSTYLYIYIDGELIQERVSNIGSILRYIPYNMQQAEELNLEGFVLNTKIRLKNYLKDIIELLDEFVNEYLLEIG